MMASRSRSIKLRKLDVMKVREQRSLYQVVNIVCPLVLLALAGTAIYFIRRKKYRK